jgi:cyclopropane fatty-acyl-phospholipid synthase-like methyltransferase
VTKNTETKKDWRTYWAGAVERTGPEEFVAQVGYTIGGQPIEAIQQDEIEQAVREGLAFVSSDIVLDLCCGNGFMTKRIAAGVQHVYAVDFSSALIDVACRHFARSNTTFICRAAADLTSADVRGNRITKVYMLAALQYFDEESVATLMNTIRELSGGAAPIYFTDIPDVDHLWDFYNTPERRAEYERRCAAGTEAIGTWWSKQTLTELLRRSGYAVDIVSQDAIRFGAHYRFDLLARPCC